MRFMWTAVAAIILAGPVVAGEESLAGHWKLSFLEQRSNQVTLLWLLHIETKDGKLALQGDALPGAPKIKSADTKVTGDVVQIKLRLTDGEDEMVGELEAKLPKAGAKKFQGSFLLGRTIFPVVLEASSAKNLFELHRETLTKTPSDPRSLGLIFDLIDKAKDNKVPANELQELVEASLKAAELYGPRYQSQHQLRLLDSLRPQKTYAPVAVEVAKQAVKSIDPKSPADRQLNLLEAVADLLRAAGQRDMALETRLEKLEGQAYLEYAKDALEFKTPKFGGRKGKSNRAVLVELFTGAQCPPCVAADMAFDGLEKTYAPGEVVLLQYHMNIPRPEPMSNLDTDARFDYYREAYPKVRGTPTGIFNGAPVAAVGGAKEDAGARYKQFCDIVDKQIETPANVKLAVSAVRNGEKIAITAKYDGLDKPGEKVRLRLVLVEDWVRYKGANQLQYHHRVVRAMPGGARGFALKEKSGTQSAELNLDDVRKNLNRYLDDEYPEGARPMRLRDLHVVAFVQNDADDAAEILQAVDTKVK